MRFFKVALLLTLSLLILSGITYLGYLLFQQINKQSESPVKAISENTVLVIKVHKPAGLSQELQQSNLIWKDVMAFPFMQPFRSELSFLDSAIHKNEKVFNIFRNYPLWLAVSLRGRNSFGLLVLTSVPGKEPESAINDFLRQTYKNRITILTTPYSSVSLEEVIVKGNPDPFYFAVSKGVFMGSFNPDLVKKAVDRLSLNISSITGTGFQQVESITGKKVDANIYINYRYLSFYLSRFFNENMNPDLVKLSLFADWSGLDMIIKRDELLVNGYSTCGDTTTQFLPLFKEQIPQKIEISSIIPDNASSFAFFGFSNFRKFYAKLQSYQPEQAEIRDNFTIPGETQRLSDIPYFQYFLPWIANEITLLNTENPTTNEEETSYALLRVNDKYLADSLLNELSKISGKKREAKSYKGVFVYTLNIHNILPHTLGSYFGPITGSSYCFINNYIIFGNDPISLKRFIDRVKSGKTLESSKAFHDFGENMADKANIYFYINAQRSLKKIKSLLKYNISSSLNAMIDTLRKFESMGVQLNNRNGIFFTSFYLRYNPMLTREGPLQWQATIDTGILGIPAVVHPSMKGDPAILTSDMANNMIMVDNTGEILWKLHLPEKIMGKVHEIYPKNSDSALYIAITEHYTCLFNANGQFIKGYPMQLPVKSTNAATVFTFPGAKDFHILLALSDGKLHSFNLTGHQEEGWKNHLQNQEVKKEIQQLTVNHKLFFFIQGTDGQLKITDQKGNTRIKLPRNFRVSSNAHFYVNKTNKKGLFITTDITGKVVYIQENGTITEASFPPLSPNHTFIYEDINNDGTCEYIFFDRNTLYYYNKFYKLSYIYSFRRDITTPPFLIKLPDGKKMIGFISEVSNEIFLFGKKGLIATDPGIHGNTLFDIDHVTDKTNLDLIIGSGKYLRSYRLSQE